MKPATLVSPIRASSLLLLALAGCALRQAPVETPPRLSGPQRQPPSQIQQIDFGPRAHFATCVGDACPRITRKTVGTSPTVASRAPAPSPAPADPATQASAPTGSSMPSSERASQPAAVATAVSTSRLPTPQQVPARTSALASPSEVRQASTVTAPEPATSAAPPLVLVANREPAPAPPSLRTPPDSSRETVVTISYAFDGVQLTPDTRATLSALVPQARLAHRVVVAGRTDNVGRIDANNAIALARAIVARDYLIKQAPELQATTAIDARGACCYVADNDTEHGRSRNRRVEIRLASREPS